MGVLRLSEAGIVDYQKYSNFLAGNQTFIPPSDDFLEEVILTSSTSSVTFSGLDAYSAYKHLQIRIIFRSDVNTTLDGVYGTLNGDTTSSYAWHELRGDGSSVESAAFASQNQLRYATASGSTDTTNSFGVIVVDVLDFSDTSKNTTIRNLAGVSGSLGRVYLQSGLYFKTNAITSMNFFPNVGPNFVAGSRFSLYGSRG